MDKIFFRLFLASLLTFIASLYFTKKLPDTSEINRYVKTNPKQTATYEEEFQFDYEGETYFVDPVADYELYGLVVSHNNIGSFTDAYHNSKSVDIKDICVVWGTNVMSDIYQRANFSSGAWTCYVNLDNAQDSYDFEPTQLSNNHLLSSKKSIQEKMRSLHIGDQVHLRGYLVNYANSKTPQHKRKSSLVRNDTGNGACEVFFLETLRIIKEGNPIWNNIRSVTYYLNFILFAIYILCFCFCKPNLN